jgi:hypothetical protein
MTFRGPWGVLILVVGAAVSLMVRAVRAVEPAEVARQVDALLREEVPFVDSAGPQRISDEAFLRRATLDCIGRLPTPVQITTFVLDPAPDKRERLVEGLLADSRYGTNWGRYWRDVIMYRKTEERGQVLVGPLESYLTDSLNANKPWSQIATEFITAVGDLEENGACALIMAQQGNPEEVTAEVSRIFLGVQIQCAQCHDHPTDRWKREQFHELAAFFPRISSRLIMNQDRREYAVVATDNALLGMRRPMAMRRIGTPEHYMSDLDDPQARGTLMTPVLFATGQTLSTGVKDADRRATLAEWITAKDNPYFAQALVNRMWSELCGEGFYEPVDDMGPDRTPIAPQTLEYLACEFAESGYDLKWLMQTILATERYQLPAGSRRQPDEPPLQANVPQRLRADVLLDNVLQALELPEPAGFGGARGGAAGPRLARGPRSTFAAVFGYDPSERRDEIAGSIPQALAMMNAPLVNTALRGSDGQFGAMPGFGAGGPGIGRVPGGAVRPGMGGAGLGGRRLGGPGMPGMGRSTMLSRLMDETDDNQALVEELYLQVLARQPSPSETTTCLLYVKEVGRRSEAFEDILWGLVNSAEFLHR